MATRKFAIAKQLAGKRVITDKGEEIGRLTDIEVDEHEGSLILFLLEANLDSRVAQSLIKDKDFIEVPFKAISAVSDVIVVEEHLLR